MPQDYKPDKKLVCECLNEQDVLCFIQKPEILKVSFKLCMKNTKIKLTLNLTRRKGKKRFQIQI